MPPPNIRSATTNSRGRWRRTRDWRRADARFAWQGSGRVGPDLNPGDEFDVTWVFISDDGEPYYVTPYYTRIRAADTERVLDRPA